MTELDMTADVKTEDFTDDLSDEALDREEGGILLVSALCPYSGAPVADR